MKKLDMKDLLVIVLSAFINMFVWHDRNPAGVAFFCAAAFGIDLNIIGLVAGAVIGALLAMLLQFMKCAVDYSRKEYVQFEDDDYYYYVKAIPKISDSGAEKNVVKVNSQTKKSVKNGVQASQENK